MVNAPEFLTIKEAAAAFRVTQKHIYDAVKQGSIGHTKGPRPSHTGRRLVLLVRRSELETLRNDGFLRSPKFR